MVPPLPIPNREVKRCSADDTIFNGKVGSRQDTEEKSKKTPKGVFLCMHLQNKAFFAILSLYMTWRARRQLFVLFLLFLVAVAVLAVMFLPRIIKAPTCFDKKQNQDEQGVDCGGSCQLYCPAQIPDPDIIWTRTFPTTESVYNAVAYIENHAIDAAARDIPYEFRLYDADNILISRIEGRATIMPNGPTAIFAGAINVENRPPARASFAFLAHPNWIQLSPSTIARLDVAPTGTRMIDALTDPKLETTIVNNTDFSTGAFDIVAILYDVEGNAFGVSKTFVENLEPQADEKVYMSWPQAFEIEPTTVSVIALPNAFTLPKQ